jgi:hypothetical protein
VTGDQWVLTLRRPVSPPPALMVRRMCEALAHRAFCAEVRRIRGGCRCTGVTPRTGGGGGRRAAGAVQAGHPLARGGRGVAFLGVHGHRCQVRRATTGCSRTLTAACGSTVLDCVVAGGIASLSMPDFRRVAVRSAAAVAMHLSSLLARALLRLLTAAAATLRLRVDDSRGQVLVASSLAGRWCAPPLSRLVGVRRADAGQGGGCGARAGRHAVGGGGVFPAAGAAGRRRRSHARHGCGAGGRGAGGLAAWGGIGQPVQQLCRGVCTVLVMKRTIGVCPEEQKTQNRKNS